ncbi:MAG TPA: FixH family protein [Saprospiraceae bacterium]|nr:FixH family protein [Saprospiraceae bacterium]
MKINWGWGIAIFYIIFVGALLYTVWKSTTYDHSLVAKDYYAKDISYQEHYDKLLNATRLAKDLQITELPQKEAVRLVFPAEVGQPTGTIQFFNPSASHLDFEEKVRTDEAHQQLISTTKLKKGLWRVKVDWEADGKAFYKEEVIVL